MLKFLITGGAGFIGSAFIRALNEIKSASIVNIDKLTYAGNLNNLSAMATNENYKFLKLDICSQSDMEVVFNEFKPDIVYHFAAETHVDKSINTPASFLNTNVIGTASLLNASLQYWNKLKNSKKDQFRFIAISTDEVFGSLEKCDYFEETSPYLPNSPYSASKASSDHLVRAWNKTYGLPTIITNCSNNYGPFQYPEKLIPLVIINAINFKKLPVYGDGKQIRDWLYVDDHVDALLKIGQSGNIGESYNIGGDLQISNLEVVKKICNILDESNFKNSRINSFQELIMFVKDRPGHDRKYAINFSKLNKETGWIPKKSFDKGLLDTVNWYINNSKWWQQIFDKKNFVLKTVYQDE